MKLKHFIWLGSGAEHVFNVSTEETAEGGGQRAEGRGQAGGRRQISEFDVSLVYKAHSKTARVTLRNSVSKKIKN